MQSRIEELPEARALGNRLQITYSKLADLKLDPKNSRIHTKKQIGQISRSMEAFGFCVPILINSEQRVLAGHGRVEAAKLLGMTEAPTVRLEHLTEAQAKAFAIADNKLTENAAWDERLLGEQLKELSELNLDFNLEVTGFEVPEIDLFIEGLEFADEEQSSDEIPQPGSAQVSKSGDLWALGRHRAAQDIHASAARLR